jgi:ketosteroid isomerase-like protein
MPLSEIGLVRAFVGAINRHDVAEISALMSEDHIFVDSTGHTVTGRDAMVSAWARFFATFPDYRIHIESILDDGPLVAAFGSAAGTYAGRRGPVAENRIVMPAAWRVVVEDGRVKLWQVYADWTEGLRVIAADREQS